MTPSEFEFKISNLPPGTAITAEHLIVMLEILKAIPSEKVVSNNPNSYSTWDNEKIINQDTLSEWICETTKTLEKWRLTGDGPKFIDKPKRTHYYVGDVRDWLNKRKVSSTAEANMKRNTYFTLANIPFNQFHTFFYINDEPHEFFECMDTELPISKFGVKWIEEDSFAEILLASDSFSDFEDKYHSEEFLSKDINSLNHILINGIIKKVPLSHVLAEMPMTNTQVYANFFYGLMDLGLDFEVKNEDGLGVEEVAKAHNNIILPKLINNYALYKHLTSIIK